MAAKMDASSCATTRKPDSPATSSPHARQSRTMRSCTRPYAWTSRPVRPTSALPAPSSSRPASLPPRTTRSGLRSWARSRGKSVLPHQPPEGSVVTLTVAQRHAQAKPQLGARHQRLGVGCLHLHRRHVGRQLACGVRPRIGLHLTAPMVTPMPALAAQGNKPKLKVARAMGSNSSQEAFGPVVFHKGSGVRMVRMAFSRFRWAPRARERSGVPRPAWRSADAGQGWRSGSSR